MLCGPFWHGTNQRNIYMENRCESAFNSRHFTVWLNIDPIYTPAMSSLLLAKINSNLVKLECRFCQKLLVRGIIFNHESKVNSDVDTRCLVSFNSSFLFHLFLGDGWTSIKFLFCKFCLVLA